MPHRSTHHQVAAANQGKIGLIDVGSNSVRFVVYDRLKRAPYSIYNEKVMCRLGSGLAKSGTLNPCLLYTSPSPRDQRGSRMPSSA